MTDRDHDRAPVRIRMPDLSPTENEVTLLRWHVRVGETVALGQPLLEVETAKAVMDVESVAAGVLAEVLAEPGAAVPVGAAIAVIAAPGAPARPAAPPPAAQAAPAAATAPTAPTAPTAGTSRPAPRGRQARQEARLAPAHPAAAAHAAADAPAARQSFFAVNRARREGHGSAPLVAAAASAPGAAAPPAVAIAAYTLGASASAARLPSIDSLPDVIAAAALRAMAAALGLTGSGLAVTGPDGETRLAGNPGKTALHVVIAAGAAVESFRAEGPLPTLAVAPPRLEARAAGPGHLAIEPRLPLALSAPGGVIAPHHAARFLDSLVTELESL